MPVQEVGLGSPQAGQVGDSVADVSPVTQFGNETVIEGVY